MSATRLLKYDALPAVEERLSRVTLGSFSETTRALSVSGDGGKLLRALSDSPVQVLLPDSSAVSVPDGWTVLIRQEGEGQVQVIAQGTDAAENFSGHDRTAGQRARVAVVYLGSGVYDVSGELVSA